MDGTVRCNSVVNTCLFLCSDCSLIFPSSSIVTSMMSCIKDVYIHVYCIKLSSRVQSVCKTLPTFVGKFQEMIQRYSILRYSFAYFIVGEIPVLFTMISMVIMHMLFVQEIILKY